MSRETKRTILLLGKNGMLGQAIQQNYELRITNYEFVSWDRSDLDITNKKQVSKKISELKPDIIINATGYTNVDGAESDSQTAFKVNGDAVGYIAETCKQIGASLIHFSTDYVFDGTQPQGYKEENVEHLKSLNIYGESKLRGENNVKCQMSNVKSNLNVKCQKFFIIRTSWLYGAGGRNFADTMISRARTGQKKFKIVNDQFGLPTYTVDLAKRLWQMTDRLEQLEAGVYHLVNSKPQLKTQNYLTQEYLNSTRAGISWYEFAREIFKQAKKLGILSELPNIKPCASDEFPRPAMRPKYSALINTKLPAMRDWRLALVAYLQEYKQKCYNCIKY